MTTEYIRWPVEGGGGVSSLNGETGAITLVAGTGITITPSGQNITIASTDLAAAITSINADTTAAQLLTVGTAGTDFAIVDAGSGSHVFNLPTASASNRGALSSADWTTFNAKQSALTLGNLTESGSANLTVTGGTGAVIGSGVLLTLTGSTLLEATSSVLTITGGTNAVLGTGVTIQVKQAGTSQSGYLSSTDWNTFNSKGSGTVTTVSVASSNGFAGSSSGGATPALTLSTTVSAPVLAGNGTAISAATTTGTGSTVVLSTGPTMSNPVVGTQTQLNGSTLAASTSYVDTAVANAVAGVNPAVAVQAATTTASNTSGLTYNNGVGGIGATFTGTTNTAIVVDGFTFSAVGQRLLVKNDTQSLSGAFNGIYNVTQIQTSLLPPILTRALDYDTPSDMNNTGVIPVINGTVNSTTTWLQTAQIVTVGTTPLVFVRFSASPAAFPTVTGWASYTPTLTGVGTPTINYCLFKQVGDSICVMISFMTGTVSATLFTITLPNSYVTSSLIGVNTTVVGNAAVGTSVGSNFVALVVGSAGFLYMGRQDAGNTGLAQSTASNMFGSSEQVAFTTTLIPIQGLGP